MFITELCKQTFRDIRQHKLRSALAVFGIVWGTVAVVLLLALGQGFYTASKQSMASFAQGTLLSYAGPTSLSHQGLAKGSQIHLKADELMNLPAAIPTVHYVSPITPMAGVIAYKNQQMKGSINGTSADYAQLIKFNTAVEGRFINNTDVEQKKRVIFLYGQVKNKLFGSDSAVGKVVTLQGVPFTVVGNLVEVVKGNVDFLGTDAAIIPYTTWKQIYGDQDVPYFYFKPANLSENKLAQRSVLQYLAFEHKFDPADKTALQFWNTAELSEFVDWFLRAIQLFLGFCGAMTLGVGGVGLANTMYLIITQRTQEIGLRMAVGARDWQIMWQFLFESSFLVFLGCLMGLVLSGVSLLALNYVALPPWLGKPEVSPFVIVATLIILSVVGLAAGYFPARRAAKMTPIEALSF